MATTSVSMAPPAVNKTLAHILKHHKNDCIGVLLGSGLGCGQVEINDVVPLFHERVTTSAMETALEMVEAFNDGDDARQIIGVYDAPIKDDDQGQPLSSLALSLAEQIKQANNSLDCIVVRVKVPKNDPEHNENEEVKTREITPEMEESMRSVILEVHACQSSSQSKKVTLSTSSDPCTVMTELLGNQQRHYMDIIDFDDHLADVAQDWTNPDFE